MSNAVTLTFAGDSKSLERSFDAVGRGAKEMADDLDTADKETGKFSRGVEGLNSKIDESESKFMGAADLVDGLSGALGISLGPTVDYARAFGDIAGGFTATLGPALEAATTKFGKLTWVTKIQAVAQGALNAVMAANPIFLVVAAVAALTAGFVIAYKKSETFRNVVDGAMAGVRSAIDWTVKKFEWFVGKLTDGVSEAAGVLGGIAELITTPYRLAFRGIADLWNNTVGKLHVSIPGFMGFGGVSFDVPDIPRLASGGIVNSPTLALIGEAGPEAVVPLSRGGSGIGGVTVVINTGASDLDELIRKRVRILGNGNVQRAFGAA